MTALDKKKVPAEKNKVKAVAGKATKTKSVLFTSVKNILEQAHNAAYKAVNSTMVIAYWHVGRLIVEQEQHGEHKAEYGKAILQELSDKLNNKFNGGFSVQNLANMRQFYSTFPILSTLWRNSKEAETIDNTGFPANSALALSISSSWIKSAEAQILSTVWRELSWSQYKLLMRVNSPDARAYYMKEAVAQNWGVRGLDRQISSFYYERILSSKNKKYVRMYEEKYKQKDDNPTIGLILCSEQNESVIKYSVLKDNRRLFSAQYKLYLPSEKELKAELDKERALIEATLIKKQTIKSTK